MIDHDRYKTDRNYRFGANAAFFMHEHKLKIGIIIGWLLHIFFNWIYK